MTNVSSSTSPDQWIAELAARRPPFRPCARDRQALALGSFDLELERRAAAHVARFELLDALRAHRLLVIDGPQRRRCFEQHRVAWLQWHARRTAHLVRTAVSGPRCPREVSLEHAPAAAMAVAPADPFAQVDRRPTRGDPVRQRWCEVVAIAGPRQRQILERWHDTPDAPLAQIARDLGITPNAARQAIDRLRRRFGHP